MQSVHFRDESMGPSVLTFDGAVLEWLHSGLDAQFRFHAALKTVGEVIGPTKRGNYDIRFVSRANGALVGRIVVDADNLSRVRPVLDAFVAAGAR